MELSSKYKDGMENKEKFTGWGGVKKRRRIIMTKMFRTSWMAFYRNGGKREECARDREKRMELRDEFFCPGQRRENNTIDRVFIPIKRSEKVRLAIKREPAVQL